MKQSENESTQAPEEEPLGESGEVSAGDPPPDSEGESTEIAGDVVVPAEAMAELQTKAEEREVFLDQLRRKTAELDNYQKRVRRERPAWEEQAVSRFVRALLPVVDNFDRALDSMQTGDGSSKGLEEGVRLIHQMLRQVLSENGVEEIVADGQQFDPAWHEAMVQESVGDRPTGEIIEVLEKGYKLRAAILRPSKVRVALNVSDGNVSDGGEEAGEAAPDATPAEDEEKG